MITAILLMTAEVSAAATTSQINGAFGVQLGQPAVALEEQGWVRLETPHGNEYKRFDPDDLLEFKTVTTSPESDTVLNIQGVRLYPGSSLKDCRSDLGLISIALREIYPALERGDSSYSKPDFEYVSYSSEAKYGFPISRSISIICSPQDGGGSALIVRYDISHQERKALEDELQRAQMRHRERSEELLKERGLDPDEL